MFWTSTWTFVLLAFLAVASSVLVGLVGVWAALGTRPHWSIRCGLLLGMISLGLLIPAHELVAMFFVQSLVVVGALAVYRMFQRRPDGTRGGFQFSIRDILLLTLLTALVFAAACSAEAGSWAFVEIAFCLVSGFVFGLATLIACGVIFSKKWLWRCVWLLVLTMAFLLAALTHHYDWLPGPNVPFVPAIVSAVIIAWLALAKNSGLLPPQDVSTAEINSPNSRPNRNFFRWTCRTVWATLSLSILLPTAGTLYFMATPPPFPKTTLPDPNAYDTFVRVGKKLEAIKVPDPDTLDTMTKKSLAAFKRKSDALLTQAHEALRQECRVPVVYDETGQEYYFPDIATLRELTRGFAVQGHTAHMDGDDTKAAECYLAAARMGKATARGGFYIDALVGMACEGIGLHKLHELQGSLSDEQLVELSATLRSLQNHDEPLNAITAREEVASYYIEGWEGRLKLMFGKLIEVDLAPLDIPFFPTDVRGFYFNRKLSCYRIMLIEIALTQYRNKHGGYPEKLDSLVPEFLDELPQEPYKADGFIYRLKEAEPDAKKTGTGSEPGYKLYSPGPNHQDDGGLTWDDIILFWSFFR